MKKNKPIEYLRYKLYNDTAVDTILLNGKKNTHKRQIMMLMMYSLRGQQVLTEKELKINRLKINPTNGIHSPL